MLILSTSNQTKWTDLSQCHSKCFCLLWSSVRDAMRSSMTPSIHEQQGVDSGSNKLSQVHRSKSLQAINQQATSSTKAMRTTFYVQHTPPRSPASPRRNASNGGESDVNSEGTGCRALAYLDEDKDYVAAGRKLSVNRCQVCGCLYYKSL